MSGYLKVSCHFIISSITFADDELPGFELFRNSIKLFKILIKFNRKIRLRFYFELRELNSRLMQLLTGTKCNLKMLLLFAKFTQAPHMNRNRSD